jgi:hypothetical protein
MELWRDQLLQQYFLALSNVATRNRFLRRPPILEETLHELASFGETVLGSPHDEAGEDGSLEREYVCSVRLRGHLENEGLVIGAGINPTLAALRCLVAALQQLADEAAAGLGDLEAFLRDH